MENFLDSQVFELVRKHAAPLWGARHHLVFIPEKVLFALNSLILNKEHHAPNLLFLVAKAATEDHNGSMNTMDIGSTLLEFCSIFNEWDYDKTQQNKALDGFLWDVFNLDKATPQEAPTDAPQGYQDTNSFRAFQKQSLTQQTEFLWGRIETLISAISNPNPPQEAPTNGNPAPSETTKTPRKKKKKGSVPNKEHYQYMYGRASIALDLLVSKIRYHFNNVPEEYHLKFNVQDILKEAEQRLEDKKKESKND